MKPIRILMSSGEPAGIGPNLAVMIAQTCQDFVLSVLADPLILEARAAQMGLPLTLLSTNKLADHTPKHSLYIEPITAAATAIAGELNVKNAPYVLQQLEAGANACLNKTYDALLTLPVQKSIINDAGIKFSGHTEFFRDVAQVPNVVMMLTTEKLRVALVTTHLPLKQVSDAITETAVRQAIEILHQDLVTRFGIAKPRILVAGLNPHAGEQGHLGSEEQEIIKPVIQDLNKQQYKLTGPLPADTLFTPKYLDQADAVLCMYHDQGLPTLKFSGFGQASNITLGLPFIRTSVDHGTALDLAKNSANSAIDIGSLKFTLEETRKMIHHNTKHS